MPVDSSTFSGLPRLKILSAASKNASVVKTLYLPFPDKDGIELVDFPARGKETKLIDGSMRYQGGGILKRLTLNYAFYDPRVTGKTIGTAEGQIPTLADLYDIITLNNSKILVSPCSSHEIWFRAYVVSELTRTPIGKLAFSSVSIEFKGLDVFASANASSPL